MNFGATLFILIGTVFMLAALWNAIAALESKRWPEAPGVISTSYKKERHDAESGTYYSPVVAYRYQIGERELTGKRVSFGNLIPASIAERYRAGQEVLVHYDPEKPEQCVLEPGLNTPLVIQFVASCAAIAAGIYFL